MLLRDIMNVKNVVCTESTPLEQVFELMQRSRDGFATVVENRVHQKPIGIITEHDICVQIVGKSRNPRGMAAANVMNTKIVKASHDANVADLAKFSGKKGMTAIMVVDNEGILCGTVSAEELSRPWPQQPDDAPLVLAPNFNFASPQTDRIF